MSKVTAGASWHGAHEIVIDVEQRQLMLQRLQ